MHRLFVACGTRALSGCFVLLPWLFYSCALYADDMEWRNAISGNFNESSNWNVTSGPGTPPPGPGDEIELNEAGQYTITLKQNEAADRIFQSAGVVTLLSDSAVARTLDLTTGRADVIVRNSSKLNIGSATNPVRLFVGDQMPIGTGTGDGIVEVRGENSFLNVQGMGSQSIGSSGFVGSLRITEQARSSYGLNGTLQLGVSGIATSKGTVEVDGGSEMTTGNINIATVDSGATGTMTVSGAQSMISQMLPGTTLTIGSANSGVGELNIFSGGRFTSGTGISTVMPTGILNLDDGVLSLKGDLLINGGTFNKGNSSFLGFSANSSVTASNGAQLNFAGASFLDDGVSIEINSGADVIATDHFVLGGFLGGELIVGGLGSTFGAPAVTIGVPIENQGGGTNRFTLRDSATATISGELNIGTSLIDESMDFLDVKNDASMIAGNINVSTGPLGSGTITVSGGASITQTGASTLAVGSTTGTGSSAINLIGGQFTTGIGLTTVNTTGSLNLDGGIFYANGDMLIDGGTLTTISGDYLELAAAKSLTATNEAQLDFSFASFSLEDDTALELNLGADLSIDTLNIGNDGTSGEVVVDGMGTQLRVSLLSIGRFESMGTLTLRNDAAIEVVQMDISDSGQFSFLDGRVTVEGVHGNLTNQSGALVPGPDIMLTTVTGSYTQLAGGELSLEIGGTTRGSEYDALDVTNIVNLDGTLDVALIEGFSPNIGDSFDILTASSVLGTFASEDLPNIGDLLWNVEYTATSVVLEVVSPFSADFDGDGDVDAEDLIKWQGDFGGLGSDTDGDGDTDGADFLAWQRQFGGSIPFNAAVQAVPEQNASSILILGMMIGCLHRQRL
ncbi:beta strand repeat-containing protein [Bythopirellula goksoeyrii]|nr:hypothetical protein [Bythopirellula goksoeyrii]